MYIFVFDMDGTLTPSRQRIDENFRQFFSSFCRNNPVYVVSGSDLPKVEEQLGEEVIDNLKGVFCCAGNEFWQKNRKIYSHNLAFSAHEIDILETLLVRSKFPIRTGNHIEKRSGLYNFSIVGRNASLSQRQMYVDWDKKTGERDHIAKKIRTLLPRLDASVAGETGIDVYLKGNDKGQIYPYIQEDDKQIVFFGDRCEEGGNDYPIAIMADMYYNVQGWKDIEKILKEVYHEYC